MIRFAELLAASNGYLEYGAGGTTLLANRLGIRTLTIEGDRFYASVVRKTLKPPTSVKIVHVNIGFTREWSLPIFSTPTRFRVRRWRRYAGKPFKLLAKLGWFPDLVLVDGRFRRACVLETARHAAIRGSFVTIVVDDYFERDHYHQVERWLGPPCQVGRAAVFHLKPAALTAAIDESDIADAARDYR